MNYAITSTSMHVADTKNYCMQDELPLYIQYRNIMLIINCGSEFVVIHVYFEASMPTYMVISCDLIYMQVSIASYLYSLIYS